MPNPVTWFEIIGRDSVGLQKFYRDVFGWKLTPPVKEMGNYSMLEDHEPGIGGGIGGSEEDGPRVTVYVETPDPQPLLEKASRAGARVIMPVTEITPTTTIAMLVDPAGNTFGLLKQNPAQRRPATATRRAATASRPRARASTTSRRTGGTRKAGRKTTARKRGRTSR